MAEKKRKGRQKISMQRIESNEDRLISFSKRRSGIYKKATEISTLCGVDVGVLMFSPAGNPFAYGIPNMESIANRLMSRPMGDQGGGGDSLAKTFHQARLANLNKTCDEKTAYLRLLKREGEQLADEKKRMLEEAGEKASCKWWDVPVEDMTTEEMERMKVMMEEMKRSAANRLRDFEGEASSSSIPNDVNGNGMPIVHDD